MEPAASGAPSVAFVPGFAGALALHLATSGTGPSRLVGTSLVALTILFCLVPWRVRHRVGVGPRVRLARVAWGAVCLGGATLIVLARPHPDVGLEILAAGYAATLYFIPVLLDARPRHDPWFGLSLLLLAAAAIHVALTSAAIYGGSGYG